MLSVRTLLPVLTFLALLAGTAPAQDASPYTGMESREIKALSEDDIAELERGGGWGLALPAELNGVPGPAHLLELADDIPLRDDQVDRIEQIYATMREEAIAEGRALLELEAEIESQFREHTATDESLRDLTTRAAASRGRLRYVHLSRHLEVLPVLSEEQIEHYAVLRGYASDDPCGEMPAGHDEEMSRAHNDCD